MFWDYLRWQRGAITKYFGELAQYARHYAAERGRRIEVSGNFFNLFDQYYAMEAEVDVIITEMRNTSYRQPAWYRYVAGFAGPKPVVVVRQSTFPSVSAPLGWVLSQESMATMDRALRQVALDRLRAHPTDLVDVSAANLLRLLELAPIENDAAEVLDGRNLPLRWATLWTTWLALPAGAIGLAVLRRRPAAQLLALSAVYFTAVSVPFSPMPPRLRAPLDLVCCIGAAVVLLGGMRWASSPDESRGGDVIDLRDSALERESTARTGAAVPTPERSTA